jgi:hypothetical protein
VSKPKTSPITLEDLKHLFDLAVDTPLVCSGSFDTGDVDLLRRIAVMIGVDPNSITPDEFSSQYPHPFTPRGVQPNPMLVGGWAGPDGVMHDDSGAGRRLAMRPETVEERDARVAEERADETCQVGTYGRKCGRLAGDPKHTGSEA